MIWVRIVEELRDYGLTNNEIRHHMRQLYGISEHIIEEAIMVADAKSEKVLD